MTATSPPRPPAARLLAPPWWLAPALFTMAAALSGVWGYRSSPILHASAWLALPYVVPAALVAATWWPPSRTGTKARGMVLGGVGVFVALVYARLATVVLYAVAFGLWAFQRGG
ncbi:hypothetical protein [Streptomyces avidinii]|uniref:Uncharacterized protein n=1 Tax=Streptomyces avidinii TaxID=1895 RepID=A0ABS4L013_STRAV|nr:hypothetical protein [Streptomyces avidinii]MBP2034449.1 hypothetical protein [Streptomyces avidinii]GGY86346.1 hypothetical protein GCM10010343_09130 [Streptomyces avidinii]